MSRAIGISMASQKMKKRTKSKAQNTPTMAVSMTSRQIMNSHYAEWHDQSRQQHQQQADAIDADGVVNAQPRNPMRKFSELEARSLRIKSPIELQGEERDGTSERQRP